MSLLGNCTPKYAECAFSNHTTGAFSNHAAGAFGNHATGAFSNHATGADVALAECTLGHRADVVFTKCAFGTTLVVHLAIR